MTELLDAVDALTLSTHTLVPQWYATPCNPACPKGEHAHTSRVEHAPLLHQLEDAIVSTIGGAPSKSTAKSSRGVLNSEALYRFTLISSQIRDWCRMAGVTPSRHPSDNLRAWYVARLSVVGSEDQDAAAAGILRGWAGMIRVMLDPPRARELTFPCPSCGEATWTDAEGVVFRWPVRLEYPEQDPDILATARAWCRACDRVWRGSGELRALRWDADQEAS